MAIAQRFITAPFEYKSGADVDGVSISVDGELLKFVPPLAAASPAFPVVPASQTPVGLTAATVATVVSNGQTWSQYYEYDANEGLFRGVVVRTA